jgi:hypothetical protein
MTVKFDTATRPFASAVAATGIKILLVIVALFCPLAIALFVPQTMYIYPTLSLHRKTSAALFDSSVPFSPPIYWSTNEKWSVNS